MSGILHDNSVQESHNQQAKNSLSESTAASDAENGIIRQHSGGLVYFSSISNYTKRFIDRVGLPAVRIPILPTEPLLYVDDPYVLVVPTYGGGAALVGHKGNAVPIQVKKFLKDEVNRSLCRGVIASGSTNFGPDFGRAGDEIEHKLGVPYLYRYELAGTPEDVEAVREGLEEFWREQQ